METEAIKTGHKDEIRLEHVYSYICQTLDTKQYVGKFNKLTSKNQIQSAFILL